MMDGAIMGGLIILGKGRIHINMNVLSDIKISNKNNHAGHV